MSQPNLIPGLPEREGASFQPSRLERLRSILQDLRDILPQQECTEEETLVLFDIRDEVMMCIREEAACRAGE